jgi:drug/metabolite transporter (DMT)-like permease
MAIGRRPVASPISDAGPAGGERVSPLALGLIVAISVLWGLNWPAMRAAAVELSPWTFRTICVLIAGPGLLAIAALGKEPMMPRPAAWPGIALLALTGVTGWQILSAMALTRIGGGHAAIIGYTMPLWAAVISALWLGERLSGRRAAALALGCCGMLVLFRGNLGGLATAPLGAALMLGAALCWALNTVATKAYPWGIGVIALSGWQLVLGGVPIVVAWRILEPVPDLSRLSWAGVAGTLYAATVALIFCYTAYIKIVTLLPATVAAIATLAIPVVGVFTAALLLGEPLGLAELGALALVLAALLLALLPRRQRPVAQG